jgi:hypothetical protein
MCVGVVLALYGLKRVGRPPSVSQCSYGRGLMHQPRLRLRSGEPASHLSPSKNPPAARSSAIASSSVRRGGLIRAGVAQDPKTPLLVGHVDVTARVDEDVLRLSHEVAR